MSKTFTKKNYIGGNAKKITFANGGDLINLDLKLSDLNALPVSEKGYIRIVISERQTPDQYGNTHSVYENTFVPDKTKAKPVQAGTNKSQGDLRSASISRKGYDPGHPFGD